MRCICKLISMFVMMQQAIKTLSHRVHPDFRIIPPSHHAQKLRNTSSLLRKIPFSRRGMGRHILNANAQNARCAFVTHICTSTHVSKYSAGTRDSSHHPSSFRRTMTSLSSSTPSIFQDGERVQVDVNGAQYEGFIQSKSQKGGWYTIQIIDSDSEISVIKKRASQISSVAMGGQKDAIGEKEPSISNIQKNRETDVVIIQKETPLSESVPESLNQNFEGPTIIDLDARLLHLDQFMTYDVVQNRKDRLYLEQCEHFSGFDKWVTFTDLHCAPNSIDTCLNVLSKVHAEAKKRNAGILFLGDFWHHRGTVRVDCLNAILNAFSEWSQPLIMIPGNHDQVSLKGEEHALTPLQNAYRVSTKDQKELPGILIFSYPTKFMNAMFIPHIRDIGTMQSILQSKLSATSSSLFVHADVTGAYMNDLITSTHGVAPAYFPPNLPIYSGHFHKPHVVEKPEAAPGVSIRYVGSPYETTLAEASQSKALLVLDASCQWNCIEEIPLTIGRKHWRVRSMGEILELQAFNMDNMNDSLPGPIQLVNNGDRVVISVQQEDLETMRRNAVYQESGICLFDAKVKELRSVGASVEIRETKSIPNSFHSQGSADKEIQNDDLDWLLVEDLSPLTTWTNFLQNEIKREAVKNSTAEVLLKAGNELLDEMGLLTSEEKHSNKSKDTTHLSLVDITVEGFGPFKEPATYPLLGRGIVLLRGSNRDGGSDSNGSGKSTLAMASLWALTGSIDPRPVQDARVNDVVHDDSKVARATVRGKIDGKEFLIARSKSASKGSLTFMFDGEDLTKQSAKETQLAIEEHVGVGSQILSRTIFHGQHTINGLLEATDSKLKDELSIIVPMKVWRDASTIARKRGRNLSQRSSELDGMVNIRHRDLEAMSRKRDSAAMIVAGKEKDVVNLEKEVTNRFKEQKSDGKGDVGLETIQSRMDDAIENIQIIEENIYKLETEMKTNLAPLQAQLEMLRTNLNNETSFLQKYQRQGDRNEVAIASAIESLERSKERWNVNDASLLNFDSVSICPTCKQDIKDDESHQHMKQEFEQELWEGELRVADLNSNIAVDRKNISSQQHTLQDIEEKIKSLMDEIHDVKDRWQGRQSKLHLDLKDARNFYSESSKDFADAAKAAEAINEEKMRKLNSISELNTLKESLATAIDTQKFIDHDYEILAKDIVNLEEERENAKIESAIMSSVAESFGGRGVQTFLLQNTVHALQLAAQSYLDELSDGSLRLELLLEDGDRILRSASVLKTDGSWTTRPLSSLSGGQWRRCSLAMSLGFSDLVARRGRLCSSLLVLDEPLTHLDSAGRDNVGKILRKIILDDQKRIGGLSVSTILIILQDLVAEELSESFDSIDEVVKYRGNSKVVVDSESLR